MDDNNVLQDILLIVDEHHLNITEKDVLDFLKNEKRWPIRYPWGQPSVEIISQFSPYSNQLFFGNDGYLIYDEWIKYYHLGFTTIISNVLDLSESLRNLQSKILEYTGSKINGNFYFSQGSLKHRVSFDEHNHDYNVIVKPIYGKSKWKIFGRECEISKESILIPSKEMHCVYQCSDKKLSLTLNIL